MKNRRLLPVVFLLLVLTLWGCQTEPAPTININETKKDMPMFSFLYGGQESESILVDWDFSLSSQQMDGFVLETACWKDPKTGLQVTVQTKRWPNGTAEWVARLENTGSTNSWLIKDFHIADVMLPLQAEDRDIYVTYSKGTDIREDDFLLVNKKLAPYSKLTLSPKGGRSSSGDAMPYFNIHTENAGYMVAVGWAGQWQAKFERSSEGVELQAGMEKTRFVLYPGESVRTPSVTVMPWEGTEEESYNLWRSHMIACHTPRDENGELATLPIANGSWGGDGTAVQKSTIAFIQSQGYKFDAFWVDAGWFGEESNHSSDQFGDAWFKNAGDWYHNTFLYPNGLKEVSDAAHAAGMEYLLWFEPERAWCDSQLVQEHPEWFIHAGKLENTSFLFNLGDPEARAWMTDFISSKIQEYGVDIYRQDFNTDPLPYWEYWDSRELDRQGIAEMKYIEGEYLFLEGLLQKNPGLVIDNCAGGGRRLDYEMMNYSLPLFRSDYQCFPDYKTTPVQVQTDGLAHWVPLNGACVQYRPGDTYSFRSNLAYGMQVPASPETAWQQAMIAQFHRAQPYFAGAYYKLTEGEITDNSVWYAYQQARDDLNGGFVLAFRREDCAQSTKTLSVRVPEGTKEIIFTDADTGECWTQQVEAPGAVTVTLEIGNAKESKLIFYETK